MKKYLGNFLGLVIQNNDPEKRGRIKIWVPHVSVTVYDKWNEDKTVDKNVIFPDKEKDADLAAILPDLKRILPWAECSLPIFGGSASGKYNALDEKGTTSDSNYWLDDFQIEGKRPGEMFKKDYPDAFTQADAVGNRFVNPHAHQYKPSPYSNLARGMFSIPNVGAHVWVFFQDGDPKYPVYFGVMYGQEDWKRIYDLNQATGGDIEDFGSTDYPQSYENVDVRDGGFLNTDTKTFRAKTVFNSNKHSIELIDTDLREILKMTHYSGSFLEFNNFTTSQLAVGNDQKLVVGDQFLTVKKNQSSFVQDHQENIVGGDVYRTVGQWDKGDVEQIKTILQDIHNRKRLFEIKRTSDFTLDSCGWAYPNGEGVSPLQSVAGAPAPCPTCCPGKLYFEVFNICDIFIPFPCSPGIVVPGIHLILPMVGACGAKWTLPCKTCCGTGISPSTQDGNWAVEPLKTALAGYIKAKQAELFPIQRKLGNGGNEIISIHGNKTETIGQVMNDFRGWRTDPRGKIRVAGVAVDWQGTYEFMRPAPIVEYVDVDPLPGGDYSLTVSNRYKLLVGGGGVNIKTFGNVELYGGIVTVAGEQVNISSKGEVNISGQSRVSLQGRSVSLDPHGYEQVVVNGGLGVTRNMIINGATHHEGEVYLHHITAPLEYQTTECADSLKCATLFPCFPPPSPGPASIDPTAASLASVQAMWAWMAIHTHWMPPWTHFHYFKNVPLDLWETSDFVRMDATASSINAPVQTPSKPVRTPIPNCCALPWTCIGGIPCMAPSFREKTPVLTLPSADVLTSVAGFIAAGELPSAINGIVSNAISGAISNTIASAVSNAMSSVVSNAVNNAISTAISNVQSGAIASIINQAVGQVTSVAAVAQSITSNISNAIAGINLGNIANNIVGQVTSQVSDAVQAAVSDIVSQASNAATAAVNALSESNGGIISADVISGAISDVISGNVQGAIANAVNGVVSDTVSSVVSEAMTNVNALANTVTSVISDTVSNAGVALSNIASEAAASVSQAVGTISSQAQNVVSDVTSGVVSNINNVSSAVANTVAAAVTTGIVNDVTSAVTAAVTESISTATTNAVNQMLVKTL